MHAMPRIGWILFAGLGLGFYGLILPALVGPAEDAAILYRYAEHLAHTGQITYNPGEAPVEGATDFLWMVLLAGWAFLGGEPYQGAIVFNLLGLTGTAFVLLSFLPKARQSPFWGVFILSALLINSQWMAAVQGFNLGLLMWVGLAGFRSMLRQRPAAVWWAGLLLVAFRPDAILWAAPWALWSAWETKAWEQKRFRVQVGMILLLGLGYFGWRWAYFGLPLPLPFYVKIRPETSWGPKASTLRYLLHYLLKYLWPLLLGLGWLAYRDHTLRRSLLLHLLLVLVIPFIGYSFFILEQNIADRFMILPHLLLLGLFIHSIPSPKDSNKILKRAGLLYLFLSMLYWIVFLKSTLDLTAQPTRQIGQAWSGLGPYRLSVTEAGHLPRETDWPTQDLWGLNTPQLAARGIRPADLEDFDPEVLLIDPGYDMGAQLCGPRLPAGTKSWTAILQVSWAYLQDAGTYICYMVPFSLKPDLPPAIKPLYQLGEALIEFRTQASKPLPIRYHLYALRKDLPEIEAMKAVLEAQGGISVEAYFSQTSPDPTPPCPEAD